MDAYSLKIGLVLIGLGLMVSCVKDPQDIPGNSSEDEVFGLWGTFGNEELSIGAGVNLWTNIPKVSEQDSLKVYASIFSLNGCLENCTSSWTFKFYQAQPASNDPEANFQNTILVGQKAIVTSVSERQEYNVLLATHPGLFMSGYSYWEDLNDPSTTFFHEYQTTVGYNKIMDVCFKSLAYTGCMYKQCISFDPATEVPCLLRIEPKLENPRYLSLNVKPTGTAPFQVLWSNGATTQSRVIPLQDTIAEVYADVIVVDALGNSSRLTQTIRLQNLTVDACYFPISLTSIPILNASPEIFENKVEVTYIDEVGDVWSSTGGAQPQEAKMTIDEKTFYGPSPLMQPSYLVELTAHIWLYNETTGEAKLFNSERLSLSLSHP